MKPLLGASSRAAMAGVGLLILRVGAGGLMLTHGWPKLGMLKGIGSDDFGFPDPIGIGSAATLILAVFAEFLCSILLAVGLATRAAAVPLLSTMLVAALVVHAEDPLAKKELALLYAVPFLALILTGPGPFSLDRFLFRDKGKDGKGS